MYTGIETVLVALILVHCGLNFSNCIIYCNIDLLSTTHPFNNFKSLYSIITMPIELYTDNFVPSYTLLFTFQFIKSSSMEINVT